MAARSNKQIYLDVDTVYLSFLTRTNKQILLIQRRPTTLTSQFVQNLAKGDRSRCSVEQP